LPQPEDPGHNADQHGDDRGSRPHRHGQRQGRNDGRNKGAETVQGEDTGGTSQTRADPARLPFSASSAFASCSSVWTSSEICVDSRVTSSPVVASWGSFDASAPAGTDEGGCAVMRPTYPLHQRVHAANRP
jgi:hypothetical protein